jgi:hypothetical protein
VISTPAGADIEVDGGFVGKSWERKLKAGGGNVNLNVELEAQAK